MGKRFGGRQVLEWVYDVERAVANVMLRRGIHSE